MPKLATESQRYFEAKVRESLKAELRGLRKRLKQLRAERRAAVQKARAGCRASRARARKRAADIRTGHRQLADAEIRELRLAGKTACERAIERARKKHRNTERQVQAEKLERARYAALLTGKSERVRKKQSKAIRAVERRSESDDEVRSNLDPSLVPLFDRLRRSIKATPRKSRTEAFLQWVEEHPDEVAAHYTRVGEEQAAREIAAFEARHGQIEKALKRKRLRPTDWQLLGIDPAAMHRVGLNPRDPRDVLAYLDSSEASPDVPF